VAALWSGSVSFSVFWKLREISGRLALVSSNFKNISCVTFLKHKTAENRELALWHLVNSYFRKMHKNATKCNETLSKWCKNKHVASKIMDTLETYHEATTQPGGAAQAWLRPPVV
jgi:hypothetical protein